VDHAEIDGQWELYQKSATFCPTYYEPKSKILTSTSHSSNQYPALQTNILLIQSIMS
jgi:hypothetical protein